MVPKGQAIYMRSLRNALLCAVALVLIGAAGCASQQAAGTETTAAQATPPPSAPAAAPGPAPVEIRSSLDVNGPQVSIFHPDTHTLYLWMGDPRPAVRRPMTCVKIQMSDSPSGGPVTDEPCS